VYLPLHGFADSLNLSVATALVLHTLFTLAPDAVGDLPEDEKAELRAQWYDKERERGERERERERESQYNWFLEAKYVH
jgi:hypothetical protein